MDLLPLPDLTARALREQSVPPKVQLAVRLIVTCLEQVCAGVADDCDADLRHDDSTSEGQLRWRRCRNFVKKLLDAGTISGFEEDNALRVRVGDAAVSFYSSRHGIEHPDLSGPSKTKKAVVSEMQMQLDGLAAPDQPARLVVIYEADQDGLAAAAVGTLRSATDWAWRFSAYARRGLGILDIEAPVEPFGPSYETEPEPELPPFRAVGEEDAQAEDES
jgi:hypothetical protein